MKIDLSFAELHTPLFLGKINWGQKLNAGHNAKGDLKLAYDREEKELLVSCGSCIAIIPTSNVVSMTPESTIKVESPPALTPAYNKPGPKPKAQVSGPHDHVFAQGPGKTRD